MRHAKGEGMSDLIRTACKEAKQGNMNLKQQQVRHIGNKFVNNVVMSAQEAVYLLLQLLLRRSSRKVVFVNTSPTEDRVHLLKSGIIISVKFLAFTKRLIISCTFSYAWIKLFNNFRQTNTLLQGTSGYA